MLFKFSFMSQKIFACVLAKRPFISEVIVQKKYRHTRPTNCSTQSTKVVGKRQNVYVVVSPQRMLKFCGQGWLTMVTCAVRNFNKMQLTVIYLVILLNRHRKLRHLIRDSFVVCRSLHKQRHCTASWNAEFVHLVKGILFLSKCWCDVC